MAQLGLAVIAAAALWLIGAGVFMALKPERALQFLSLTASSRSINNVEQGLRLVAGMALVLRSPASKLPYTFEIAGWFIILSSLVLLILPLQWHAGYAIWWANRLKPVAVRAIAPVSIIAGVGMMYAAM